MALMRMTIKKKTATKYKGVKYEKSISRSNKAIL